MAIIEVRRGELVLSTDPARMDVSFIHGFLTRSYWAEGIPEATVRRSIAGSLCFGIFSAERQVGFARIISDRATFAHLADVFVVEGFRGRGLAKWMMDVIVAHPELQGLRRWTLGTRDAHELYRRYGFTAISAPERAMERVDVEVYRRAAAAGGDGGAGGEGGS